PSRLIIALDHLVQFRRSQAGAAPDSRGKCVGQQAWRQPVVLGSPSLTYVEQLLQRMNPLAYTTQLVARAIPAGDLAQKFRALAIKIGKALAQKFADDHRVEDRCEIFRRCDQSSSAGISAESIDGAGEVCFIGAGAIVASTARANG